MFLAALGPLKPSREAMMAAVEALARATLDRTLVLLRRRGHDGNGDGDGTA